MMHLHGRVFTRLQTFNTLPTALQHEANALQDDLTLRQHEVFGKHHTLKLKTVYGVRAKHLLEKIDEWILRNRTGHIPGSTEAPASSTFPVAPENRSGAPTAAPASKKTTEHVPPSRIAASPHAKTLLDALVLKGFLTLHKEDKHKHRTLTGTEDLSFKDNDLLVPLSKAITEQVNATITVWDLVDGAVFAGCIKRKAGVLEPLTHGKEIYAIVNARCKTLTLFKTDLSRKPIVQLEAASMKVAFDTTRYDHGVKLWTPDNQELLHATSQQQSDALVHALLAVGATHEKRVFLHDEISPSQLHHPNPAMMQRAGDSPDRRGSIKKNPSLKHKIINVFKKDEGHGNSGGYVADDEMSYGNKGSSSSQPTMAP